MGFEIQSGKEDIDNRIAVILYVICHSEQM